MSQNQKTALLIIDMINDFQFGYGPELAKKAAGIADSLSKLKQKAAETGIPVIYINDHYNLWQADLQKIINKCRNTLSTQVIDALAPGDKDYFLIKPKHSAFYGTALNTLLYHLKIDTLILTGLAGNICVLFTANDAYMRGYNLIVPPDTVASVSDEDEEYALRMMKNVLKAKVEPSDALKL
ncbi:cysteine hydrolase [Bacillus sp. FJAT-42376]|uniref:isochorismatase family cysteine hydrolase n=1 Tax=Bacillus sp. FJAT-42376 TaxID=2014076 RepID=UPI000F514D2A|nr:isochorismatase family cysteine hydrolase [Bacillus sp. FJAT-42376]AZB41161.1 cysteine hydrolase [Bacillus sp. FJAT-42376]